MGEKWGLAVDSGIGRGKSLKRKGAFWLRFWRAVSVRSGRAEFGRK